MDNIFLNVVPASAIGGSIGSALIELIKEVVKGRMTAKWELKKEKQSKIMEKRIIHYEMLFRIIEEMSDISSDNSTITAKMIEAEVFLRENNLYLEEQVKGVVYRFCDYFKEVVNAEKERNVTLEDSFIREYKNYFIR